MVQTASTMLELGTRAPDFHLPDVCTGEIITLNSFSDKKALLVMFICRHCPFVQHVKGELRRIGQDYKDHSLGIIAISSNDVASHPEDSPESLCAMGREEGFNFPICYDETQEVAKAFTASCTPDFFLFDGERKLVYRGQLDDSRPSNQRPITGKDLREAIDAVLSDQSVSGDQKPSIGCNIKWKPGNEPSYFRS